MEIGAAPELQDLGIDWESARGHEYLLFRQVVRVVSLADSP